MAPKGNTTNHPSRKGVKIRPYKGGRTALIHVAVRPEIKLALLYIAGSSNKSPGDILEELIEAKATPEIVAIYKRRFEDGL